MKTPALRGLAFRTLVRLMLARLRHGRPVRLAARILGGLALSAVVLHAGVGPAPEAGALTGIAAWLAITIRRDIAPPPGR